MIPLLGDFLCYAVTQWSLLFPPLEPLGGYGTLAGPPPVTPLPCVSKGGLSEGTFSPFSSPQRLFTLVLVRLPSAAVFAAPPPTFPSLLPRFSRPGDDAATACPDVLGDGRFPCLLSSSPRRRRCRA